MESLIGPDHGELRGIVVSIMPTQPDGPVGNADRRVDDGRLLGRHEAGARLSHPRARLHFFVPRLASWFANFGPSSPSRLYLSFASSFGFYLFAPPPFGGCCHSRPPSLHGRPNRDAAASR